MKTWLLDTGPIVAYIDRDDASHARVVPIVDRFTGNLLSTAAVIVESMHLLAHLHDGPELLLQFIIDTGIDISECTSLRHLREAITLMKKYQNVSMDFADATLVLLAEKRTLHDVCTLDERGFRTFRTRAGKSFNLVIQDGENASR